MPTQLHASNTTGCLTVKAHRGDGSVLLGLNHENHLTEQLARYAVECIGADGKTEPLLNRVRFKTLFTSAAVAEDRKWAPIGKPLFQESRWVDCPLLGRPGGYDYRLSQVTATFQANLPFCPRQSKSAL